MGFNNHPARISAPHRPKLGTDTRVSTFYERLLGLEDDNDLDDARRLLACSALGIGLLTFFLPLITTQPAILNETRWSMYGIVAGVYAGRFFPIRTEVVLLPISFLIAYALMVCSLIRLCFARPQAVLRFVAGADILLALRAWYWEKADFQQMFHSSAGSTAWPQVGLGTLCLSVIASMAALLVITARSTGPNPRVLE